MKLSFTAFLLLFFISANSQLLTWSPDFIQESSSPIDIIMDATKGNQGLKDYASTSDVYVHIGVITNLSASSADWKYAPFTWGTTNSQAQATYFGNNKWKYTITGGLRAFFGITNASEKILYIAILFRNGAGDKAQRNADASDMYIPVYDAGLNVRLTDPLRQPKFVPVPETITKHVGDALSITAKSSQAADLKLYLNGTQVGTTVTNGTSITATPTITTTGTQTIIAEAKSGTTTKYDTISFFVSSATTVLALPAGVKDGINYEAGDTSVTLVLFAPGKSTIAVIGDFNNWTATTQMNVTPDGNRFWIRLTGLTPGVEYAYQYLIDNSLKVADYNTEKILDPDNDKYIPAANYPSLKPYPTGKTTGIVSVLETAKPKYAWQVTNFARPDQHNLVIYELLVRDFVAAQNWSTLKDTLTYLKRLGINAIEVMPFNEFEGNNSWGYNPDFYFAPDKMYGTENALRAFIDECHKQGMAVIMDMVLNHSMGSSPMVQMYFDAANNVPAANNPWFNQYATHAYNVGYQFNHESQATKDFTQRVVAHWLTNYHIDGYRFDLAKGFTQKRTCDATGNNCDENALSAYDQSRVNIWDTIYKQQQQVSPGSYTILEMFADNSEETVYANAGMMIWGNLNYNFNQATMGYSTDWDFNWGIYKSRNWSQPNLVTYQESHDEERLMYKNLQYGNSSGSYNVKDLNTALKRNEMAASFWATIPGPKMLWEFEELGYDYSINTCEDGTVNNNCRTNPKPIRWDYYQNPNRKALYDVYSKLIKLKLMPNFATTFTTGDVSWDLTSSIKWLKLTSDSLKVMVVGNFDVTPKTASVTFQNAGTWYSYLTGTNHTATGAAENITLQPGEYYVYTNRDVNNLVATPVRNVSAAINNMALSIFPNPVNSNATISYNLPESGTVNISILDMAGRQLSNLFTGFEAKGIQNVSLNNNSFNSSAYGTGAYLLKLEVNGQQKIQPFIIAH